MAIKIPSKYMEEIIEWINNIAEEDGVAVEEKMIWFREETKENHGRFKAWLKKRKRRASGEKAKVLEFNQKED